MEFGDLLGFLMFVAFVGISLVAKAAQSGNRKAGRPDRPQWPGPVAGPRPGGSPNPNFPRPWIPGGQQGQPQAHRVPQAPMPPGRPTAPPRPQPLAPSLSGEGVGMEGVGTEGPGDADRVEVEINRFDREVEQFSQQPMDEVVRFDKETEQFERRHLGELNTTLKETAQQGVTPEERGGYDLRPALGAQGSLVQAVVMAEVLGKPKALRGGRRW